MTALTQADLDRALASFARRLRNVFGGDPSLEYLAGIYDRRAARVTPSSPPPAKPEPIQSAREVLARSEYEDGDDVWKTAPLEDIEFYRRRAEDRLSALRAAGYEILSPEASQALTAIFRAADRVAVPCGLGVAIARLLLARDTSR